MTTNHIVLVIWDKDEGWVEDIQAEIEPTTIGYDALLSKVELLLEEKEREEIYWEAMFYGIAEDLIVYLDSDKQYMVFPNHALVSVG